MKSGTAYMGLGELRGGNPIFHILYYREYGIMFVSQVVDARTVGLQTWRPPSRQVHFP